MEEKEKNILDEFESVDKKYSGELEVVTKSPVLELERQEMPEKSDSEILDEAKNSLAEYEQENKSKIENTLLTGLNKVSESQSAYEQKNSEKKQNLQASTEVQKEVAKNDAIKKGIARSSIIINKLDAFDSNQIAEYNQLDKELSAKIASFSYQIDNLVAQKHNAMQAFDIAYAVKLNQKITSLTNELVKQQEAVKKYNDGIAKQEADYALKIEKENQALITAALNQQAEIKKLDSISKAEKAAEEKFEIAKVYFLNLDVDEAFNELFSKSVYKEHLGAEKFNELIGLIFKKVQTK